MFVMFRLFSALTLLAMTGTIAHAACTPINYIPYTISQSGSYCVTADLSIDLSNNGFAITVSASHVDLDFQGHSITNTSSGTEIQSDGVQMLSWNSVLTDVTVHNGLVNGFQVGVSSYRTSATTELSNLTVDSMTVANSRQRGIYMQGANLTITNNKIMTTRGKTNVAGIYLFSGYPSITASNRAVIQGNTIFNTISLASDPQNSASAYGIYAAGFVDLLIRDNSVFNTWVKANTTTYSSAAGIMINQMLGVCAQACATDPVGGLVVQDNNVSNSIVITRTASPNLTGIQISYPGDHAIVSGSKIMLMNTGIDVGNSWGSWPNTPPVLLLNNTITSAITPIIGGVTLPQ